MILMLTLILSFTTMTIIVIMAQNDAMREAVQNSTNFHYFDLFEQVSIVVLYIYEILSVERIYHTHI